MAVVMPQYSAVTQLQRPFCSHAPSQKHRVTSLASSGKGGPAGLFCSPLVFFFLPFSVFSLSSSSPVVPPIFFFFSPPEHLLRRFTLAVVDGIIKKKSASRRAGDAGDSGSLCGISMKSRLDCPIAAMDVAFGSGGASEGITRHLAQRSCVTVTLLWGRQ